MSTFEIDVKPLPAVRLASLSQTVASQPEVGPVVGPLFDRVEAALDAANAEHGLPLAEYDMDENGVRITVGFEYDGPALDAARGHLVPGRPERRRDRLVPQAPRRRQVLGRGGGGCGRHGPSLGEGCPQGGRALGGATSLTPPSR